MREAKVTCLSTSYQVPDLGLSLRKGDVTWLDVARAQGSKDLTLGVRLRALDVQWIERYRMKKKPEPPFVRMSRNNRVRLTKAPGPPQPPAPKVDPKPAPPPVSIAEEVSKQVGLLKEELLGSLQELVGQATASPSLPPELLAKLIEESVRRGLGGEQVGRAPVKAATHEGVPMFIPAKIVKTDAEVTVNEKAAHTEDVDAAAAALRALKNRRSKPGKNDGER